MKKIVILYHGDCWDGLGGAWAAWKKFGSQATYLGLKYGAGSHKAPAGLKSKEIYIIDFGFTAKVMKEMVKDNQKVVVLDHHVSAKETIKLAHEYVYKLNHSGCILAWRYFHPKKKVPRLLLNIEDMDIWKFRLAHTKEVFSYLALFDFKLGVFSKLVSLWENAKSRKKIIEIAKQLLKYENKLIEKISRNTELINFGGHKILAVNSTNFASELGHLLAQKRPPFALVWNETGGIIKVSLRSNGNFNVAKIAEKFGGGGHEAAAGFAIPVGKKLPWKILK